MKLFKRKRCLNCGRLKSLCRDLSSGRGGATFPCFRPLTKDEQISLSPLFTSTNIILHEEWEDEN